MDFIKRRPSINSLKELRGILNEYFKDVEDHPVRFINSDDSGELELKIIHEDRGCGFITLFLTKKDNGNV